METLSDKLLNNKKLPMHMPGHKRSAASFPHLANLSARQDITEITGFDNLHDAHGILKESMNTAAHLRGADRAFYLINGSTCGILAAISACVPFGGKIIMARNCHKSVYNAAELIHAQTVYITPEHEPFTGGYGCISPDAVRTAIAQNHDAHAMVITSPTYEGIVSDIRKICDIAHGAHIPVIVDAAHGAHFGYADFPKDAVSYGGDIVIESLHKTLSGLTQTAVCYVSGNIADADKIEKKLSVFESSSPSYLLLSSIDGCIKMLYSDGDELFSPWITALNDFYRRTKNLKNFKFLSDYRGNFFDYDRSKIVISSEFASGTEIFEQLQGRGIECEMAAVGYCLAMTGIGDTPQSLLQLYRALEDADNRLTGNFSPFSLYPPAAEQAMPLHAAAEQAAESIPFSCAVGRISAEYIWAYPPGIPIIAPGERITEDAAAAVNAYQNNGIDLSFSENGKILVIK